MTLDFPVGLGFRTSDKDLIETDGVESAIILMYWTYQSDTSVRIHYQQLRIDE